MPNGHANIQIDNKKAICFENIKDNANLNENLLSKLNDNLSAFKLSFNFDNKQ